MAGDVPLDKNEIILGADVAVVKGWAHPWLNDVDKTVLRLIVGQDDTPRHLDEGFYHG